MTNELDDVLEGNLGYFWPQVTVGVADLRDESVIRGFIHQRDDSMVEVRLLDERDVESGPLGSGRTDETVSVFGVGEKTGLLLPEVASKGFRTQIGSGSSITWYRSRALIARVDLETVASSRLVEAALVFPDGLAFAGESALDQTTTWDPETKKVSGVTYKLTSSTAEQVGGKHGAFELTISPDWRTTRGASATTIETGLLVSLRVRRPRKYADFRSHLIGVQDLLNMAHDRFTPARSGTAQVHSNGEGAVPPPRLWMHECMVPPAPRTQSGQERTPLFFLADLGGAPGLRRWLSVRDEYPDAAAVVTANYRGDASHIPARLLETAAAIEMYVNQNRRNGAAWAKKSSAAPDHATALARRVGAPFDQLVGDSRVWGKRFRAVYNGIKHDPSFARDPDELWLLWWSGRVLLMAALLDRVAGSKAPSRRIFDDYRVTRNGSTIRSKLGT
ncbi:MAG TPA: hypothetical protein VNS81_08560 [Nocardioides sp.]|nr:hypothetical protein [Nocardioides sp.]